MFFVQSNRLFHGSWGLVVIGCCLEHCVCLINSRRKDTSFLLKYHKVWPGQSSRTRIPYPCLLPPTHTAEKLQILRQNMGHGSMLDRKSLPRQQRMHQRGGMLHHPAVQHFGPDGVTHSQPYNQPDYTPRSPSKCLDRLRRQVQNVAALYMHEHPLLVQSYYRYCGKNYNHAWSMCGPKTFCESDDDCAAGATCFEDLPEECNAFYMEHPELRKTPRPTMRPTDPVPTDSPTRPVPTRSPTRAPAASPTTQGPTRYLDPKNFMFCGGTWDTVECKEENHCPTGLECTGNQVCFRRPQCNIVDLTGPSASPSSSPISVSDDPANYRFCGATFFDAIDNCSLETHCASGSDASCPTGMHCYDNVPGHCNTFYMTAIPTPPPVTRPTTPLRTRRPTPVPAATYLEPADGTPRPTDGRDDVEDSDQILWCGQDQSDANRNCGSNSFRCVDSVPCPFGWECFEVKDRHCDSLRTPIPTVPQLRPFRPTSHVTETPIPTSGPVGSRTPHSFCGRDLSEATRMCGYHSFSCDSSAHCPIGWECYLVDEALCGVSSNEGAETPSRTLRPSLSPLGSFTIRPTNVPTEKPWTESSKTKQPTQKPTNMPITSDGDSALPAENFIQTTSKPTSKLTTYRPSKLPTPKPVADRPTIQPLPVSTTLKPAVLSTSKPTSKLTTYRPSKLPTPKPVTYRPTTQPIPVPTTLKPTVLRTPSPMVTMAPTLKESQTSSPNEMPAKYSISKPVGMPKNPSLQSAMNGDSTKEESNSSEEASSAMEGLDPAATKRPRLYCLSDFGTVDKDCVNAMECSEGNPCPTGYFCTQIFCKSRPSPNGYLDLCPYRFAGRHTKDCKTYYDCDFYGYVGPTYTCREGFKFDKSSSRCIHEYLVNEYCFGAIESSNETKPKHANTQTFDSSNVAMDDTVDSSDESHAESEIDHSTYTFSLTSPPTSLSQTRSPTDIHITPKNLTQQSNSSTVQKDKHDLSTWYEWDRSGANDQSQCLNAHWLGILLPIQFVLVFS
ncbi:hypothetical protein ACHAWF_011370 [Thalassiosira exigua]